HTHTHTHTHTQPEDLGMQPGGAGSVAVLSLQPQLLEIFIISGRLSPSVWGLLLAAAAGDLYYLPSAVTVGLGIAARCCCWGSLLSPLRCHRRSRGFCL